MTNDAHTLGKRIIAHHSKSFALASRLLPPDVRNRAVVVYAWCRRADDAVDLAPTGRAGHALDRLRRELDAVYSDGRLDDPILDAFRDVVRSRCIPRHYPQELLEGLAMDAHGTSYDAMPRLLLYSYRVAGVVGLMMCHVMGVRRNSATRNATHLGVAMQLTNICRDVEEDWHRGRLYLPADLLARHGCGDLRPHRHPGAAPAFPAEARAGVARAIADLLDVADGYYASGDRGIPALSWRCGLAVRTARKVYAAIGDRIRARGCDPLAGRAWVSRRGKLGLAAAAVGRCLLPAHRGDDTRTVPVPPETLARAEDVLPLHRSDLAHDASMHEHASVPRAQKREHIRS